MRSLGVVFVLFSFACGSSPASKDAASQFDGRGFDSNLPVDLGGLDSNLVVYADSCAWAIANRSEGTPLDQDVDAGSCESRPTVSCENDAGAEPTLAAQMGALVGNCQGALSESFYTVTFTQGCADHLFLYGLADFDATRTCMVSALNASRFACAEQVSCWAVGSSTLM
jgi:hypothetical protein